MGGRTSSSGMGTGGLITYESDDFGKPGTYVLYRAGNLDAPNGMIFLEGAFDDASWYVTNPIYDSSNVETVEEYQLQIKSPLHVHSKDKAIAILEVWKQLHPGEEPKVKVTQKDGKSVMNRTDWQKIDRQNAKALAKSGHDAVIITDDAGHHEIQIHKSSATKLANKRSVNVSKSGLKPPEKPGGAWTYTANGHKFEYSYTRGKGWSITKSYKYNNGKWEPHSKPKQSYSYRNPFDRKMHTVRIPEHISENVNARVFKDTAD